MKKLFISCAFTDADAHYRKEVCDALETAEIEYNSPRTPTGRNQHLPGHILQGCRECHVCVFIATTNSVISPWCLHEIGAFCVQDKPILIYNPNNQVKSNQMPPFLEQVVWHTDVHRLITAIKNQLRVVNASDLQVGLEASAIAQFEDDAKLRATEIIRRYRDRLITAALLAATRTCHDGTPRVTVKHVAQAGALARFRWRFPFG